MSTKPIKTIFELNAWFNQNINGKGDCPGTKVKILSRENDPEAYGQVWTENVRFEVGSGVNRDIAIQRVGDLVREAVASFDVHE